MSVTFLTNEDKAAFENAIDILNDVVFQEEDLSGWEWELGNFSNSGLTIASTKRARTTEFHYLPVGATFICHEGYSYNVFMYSDEDASTYVKRSTLITTPYTLDNNYYVKVAAGYSPSVEIADIAQVAGSLTLETPKHTTPEQVADMIDATGVTGVVEAMVADIIWGERVKGMYVSHSDGSISSSGSFDCTDYVDVSSYRDITYKRVCQAQNSTLNGTAFYDAEQNFLSSIPSVTKVETAGYQDYTTSVPNGAKYARFTIFSNIEKHGDFALRGTIRDVMAAIRTQVGTEAEKELMLESRRYVHVTPDSVGMLNVIKRARQLTDIKWTPAVDLPRVNFVTGDAYGFGAGAFNDIFLQNKEYMGIPYSTTETGVPAQYGYTRMHVGFEVPIETFVTAINNPHSVVSLESQISDNGNAACVYGLTCTSFISYAYGLSEYHDTSTIKSVPGMRELDALVNGDVRFDPTDLKLCDMLLRSGRHGVLVTDIIKDYDGSVQYVEVSELAEGGGYQYSPNSGTLYGGAAKRRLWSVEDFYTYFASFVVYRYDRLSAVTYTPCKYVPIESSGIIPESSYLPCIPYMGDKFRYKVGHIYNSTLLTEGDYFTHIRVLKDGIGFNVNGTEDYYSIGDGGITEIGFTEIGEYKATPCWQSGSDWKYGKSCTWSVIE